MKGQDPLNHRGATALAWQARSAPGPTRLEWRRLCDLQKKPASPRPSRLAVHGAACDSPGQRAPDTAVDISQTWPTTPDAEPGHALRHRSGSARAPLLGPGTSRLATSRSGALPT